MQTSNWINVRSVKQFNQGWTKFPTNHPTNQQGWKHNFCRSAEVRILMCYTQLLLAYRRKCFLCVNDNVMAWKCFPYYWPFVQYQSIPRIMEHYYNILIFSLLLTWNWCWTTRRFASDLKCHDVHVTSHRYRYNVMKYPALIWRNLYMCTSHWMKRSCFQWLRHAVATQIKNML